MKNPNIYEGDHRKKVMIGFHLIIPKGLSDEDEILYIDKVMEALYNAGHIFFPIGETGKQKSVYSRDVVDFKWDYVETNNES